MNLITKILFALLLPYIINAQTDLLYTFDFSKYPNGEALKILKKKGFEFHLDAKKLNLRFDNNRLILSTKSKKAGLFGIILKNPLHNVSKVKIVWGVERFTEGANWEKGKNRVALGAIIVLGTKNFPSGLPKFIAPAAPYFIAPFIGKKEIVGKVYLGKLYKQSGRYYCVSNSNGEVVTELDLGEH